VRDLEQEIVSEIRAWSKHALEKPNPFFNNLPACPYARAAWEKDMVGVSINYVPHKQALYTLVSAFPDPLDLCILVDLKYEKDPDNFHYYLDRVNEAIADGIFIDRDIWVMGFHPDDDVDEEVFDPNFEATNDTIYAMTFIQRLSKLEESADTLRDTGYYDEYFKDPDTRNAWDTRQSFYRRLKNAGNA